MLPALEVLTKGDYHRHFADDLEKCDYFVSVEWADTVPASKAVNEIGMFGNHNSVCAPKTPKWRQTVDRLKQTFPKYDLVK